MKHLAAATVVLFCSVATFTSNAAGAGSRPNLVLIMVDDMGFSDIGCHGGEVDTPHLDRLAARGLRYTQFYNAARCCPTRASLLTGLYPHKTGIGFMTAQDHGRPGYRGDLNRECLTIAEVLKARGYHTYMAGKWHVCRDFGPEGPRHNWPLQRGFDRFFGTLIAAGSYWDPLTLVEGNRYTKPDGDFYYTDAITDRAVDSIRDNDGGPFFLYVAYTAPHWPLHAREDELRKYRGRFDEGWDQLRKRRHERLVKEGIIDPRWKLSPRHGEAPSWEETEHSTWQSNRMEAYAAAIDHVDQGVGRIVETLEQSGQLDDTVLLFLSDNGGADLEHPDGRIGSTGRPWAVMRYVPLFTRDGQPVIAGDIPGLKPGPPDTYAGYGGPWANLSNTPFRQFKKFTHEGGIATPLIVHWPSGIDARGELRHDIAHVIDLMPTCIELAGAEYPSDQHGQSVKSLDGVSLVPTFAGEPLSPRTLFWEHRGNRAVRQDRWKLVSGHGEPWELYDMKQDRTETQDMAARHPDIVKQLDALYTTWARRSDVLPWDDLDIPFIPPNENPLTRTPEELDNYLNELKARGIEAPFAENGALSQSNRSRPSGGGDNTGDKDR